MTIYTKLKEKVKEQIEISRERKARKKELETQKKAIEKSVEQEEKQEKAQAYLEQAQYERDFRKRIEATRRQAKEQYILKGIRQKVKAQYKPRQPLKFQRGINKPLFKLGSPKRIAQPQRHVIPKKTRQNIMPKINMPKIPKNLMGM